MKNQDEFYSEMPSVETVTSILNGFDSMDAEAIKQATYRMENYMNCVDDYSWGGLCDQAADQTRFHRNKMRRVFAQQLSEGAFIDEYYMPILCEIQGNELVVVSERIVNGKYGECWIIGGGENAKFVGVAKKQDTYEKKGYKALVRKYVVEYYYTAKSYKDSEYIMKTRIIANEMIDEMPSRHWSNMPSPLYYAINQ